MVLFSKDRILVPIDFSEKSLAALKETVAFAEKGSQVYAVYVLKPMEATDPGMVWESVTAESRRENVQKLFDEKMAGSEYAGLNFSIVEGAPAEKIVDYAEQQKIELIVMPSKGRTGVSRFFMGSIAEKVIRHAHCPVLVVKN